MRNQNVYPKCRSMFPYKSDPQIVAELYLRWNGTPPTSAFKVYSRQLHPEAAWIKLAVQQYPVSKPPAAYPHQAFEMGRFQILIIFSQMLPGIPAFSAYSLHTSKGLVHT